jgi:hypothetical protein
MNGYLFRITSNDSLIKRIGEGNAHLVWAMALYLEEPDIEALASEALTDGPDDKKIDFIYLDRDAKRIVFAQGFYGKTKKDAAPANKAADLNTACAWLLSGDSTQVPKQLKPTIDECRVSIQEGEVDAIDFLYVHNFPESVNVTKELQTAAQHLRKALGESPITVNSRELGASTIEHLFATQESHIEVKDVISCTSKEKFSEKGPMWDASVMSVPGNWLHGLYAKYGDALFSANYCGFLGITRRRRINTGIRQSAEVKPKDFWVFNNGITILTLAKKQVKGGTQFTGISIINGAQTTGSIGSVDLKRNDLKDVKVLCRVIQCTDQQTINDIVKYNNTQNKIMTWDQYSNDPQQNRITEEFRELGHAYIRKRGFRSKGDQIGIEEVAQPLLAFHGKYLDANRGKNLIFDRKPLYTNAFENKKARHILLVHSLSRAIDERRLFLKAKSTEGKIISVEEEQLGLLRNLRFKQFLIAVTARSLETVIDRKVDTFTVAFSPDAAKTSNNTLVELVARWTPVVESVLSFVAIKVSPPELSLSVSNEAFLDEVARNGSTLLYASRASQQHEDFSRLVSDSWDHRVAHNHMNIAAAPIRPRTLQRGFAGRVAPGITPWSSHRSGRAR